MLTLHRMPVIFPTEYMYETFTPTKDTPKGEVYADVVRDVYSKCYGLEKVSNSLMEKVALKEYLYPSKEAKKEM